MCVCVCVCAFVIWTLTRVSGEIINLDNCVVWTWTWLATYGITSWHPKTSKWYDTTSGMTYKRCYDDNDDVSCTMSNAEIKHRPWYTVSSRTAYPPLCLRSKGGVTKGKTANESLMGKSQESINYLSWVGCCCWHRFQKVFFSTAILGRSLSIFRISSPSQHPCVAKIICELLFPLSLSPSFHVLKPSLTFLTLQRGPPFFLYIYLPLISYPITSTIITTLL